MRIKNPVISYCYNSNGTFHRYDHYHIPGKQIRWLRTEQLKPGYLRILEIVEIEGNQYVQLSNRFLKRIGSKEEIRDEVVAQKPYTSDEDIKEYQECSCWTL